MAATFSKTKVAQLKRHAQLASRIPECSIEGWSKSPVDPIRLIDVFTTLNIRQGFILRGYIFRSGGNGNGIIWAMPGKSDFPDPIDCITLDKIFLSPPKPPDALDDMMSAIDGDKTPLSYLSASIFAREAAEFGALWHGYSWSDSQILTKDPLATSKSSLKGRLNAVESEHWVWKKEKPHIWAPGVEDIDGVIKVTFITYSALGQQTINRYTDTYTEGQYIFTTECDTLAYGPAGFTY